MIDARLQRYAVCPPHTRLWIDDAAFNELASYVTATERIYTPPDLRDRCLSIKIRTVTVMPRSAYQWTRRAT